MSNPTNGQAQFDAEAEAALDKLSEQEAEAVRKMREQSATVIDEDGSVVGAELDVLPGHVEEKEGLFYDRNTGKELKKEGQEWVEVEPWSGKTMEYKGTIWEYRTVKPIAAMFLGTVARRKSTGQQKLEAILGFLEYALSPHSYSVMQSRSFDAEDDFDVADMSEIMMTISSGGGARPTG